MIIQYFDIIREYIGLSNSNEQLLTFGILILSLLAYLKIK
jgi:hypothetical protein